MTPPSGRGTLSALRAEWNAGKAAFGAWCSIPSAATIEWFCVPGIRYACLDQQHGFFDDLTLVDGIRAIERCGALPLVRVAMNVPWMVGKALDAGAAGVIVPMVEDGADAAAAVAACRYPPGGSRSYGPTRAQLFNKPETARGFEDVLCFVMIETERGLINADEIARTPGLDGIYVGPSDLTLALGSATLAGPESALLHEPIEQIAAACRQNGVIAGIHCVDGNSAARFAARGFQLVTCFKDTSLIANAALREVAFLTPRPG
ncbi:MAG: aldolase/citrate lyase family protein [Candidatus Lustribacter sp.]|jgi:4-hydroxy-2-oxoheptanedioate aldolase